MTQVPVIFGEVLFDQFPDGSNVLGGAPFNVAWHLQAFGQSPLFISRVGQDALGQRIHDAMQDWGMSTAGLQQDTNHPTGTVVISIKNNEPSFEIVPDQAYDHISAAEFPALSPSLIYHGSLAVRHADAAVALETLLRQQAAPVFVDVNLRPPWWQADTIHRLLEHARWVKLNEHEIDLLVEQSGSAEDKARYLLEHARWVKLNEHEIDLLVEQAGSAEDKARYLLEQRGLSMVILTLGDEGATCVDANGNVERIKPQQVEIVDTVGAGDAFASVIILGLIKQWPTAIMLERAQQFASAIVGNRGATVQDQHFYLPFIEQWELTSS